MSPEKAPKPDMHALVDELPEEELRRFLSMGHARLREKLNSIPGHLTIMNQGTGAVRIRPWQGEEISLAPDESSALEPSSFQQTTGEPGNALRWLAPRARAALKFVAETEKEATKLRIDLSSWRDDYALVGAPEVIAFGSKGPDNEWPLLSYLPVLELNIEAQSRLEVVVIGRGPDVDAGSLIAGLFDQTGNRDGARDSEVAGGVEQDTGSQGEEPAPVAKPQPRRARRPSATRKAAEQ